MLVRRLDGEFHENCRKVKEVMNEEIISGNDKKFATGLCPTNKPVFTIFS